MAGEGGRVPVDELREAARQRVASTSLRATAELIGMSPSGLRTFLAGTDPYAPTRARLREWYAREHGGDDPWALLEDLPDDVRAGAEDDLRSMLREWRERWGLE